MAGLRMKETKQLLDHLIDHGCVLQKRKKGFRVLLPNGDSTMIHMSVSDHRGTLNQRAVLKRAGIPWPTDKHHKELNPMTSTLIDTAPSDTILGVVQEALTALEQEGITEVTAGQVADKADRWRSDYTTIYRSLTALGYEVTDPERKTNRLWAKPKKKSRRADLKAAAETREQETRREQVEQIRAEIEPEQIAKTEQAISEIEALVSETPVETQSAPAEERVVLDTWDSWIATDLDTSLSLDTIETMAKSLGLQVEVRLYRTV